MRRWSWIAGGLAATAALAGGAFAVSRVLSRRREDLRHELLDDPPRGRPMAVRSEDGTLLHAEVFGPDDAPTIVLSHGWVCAVEFWALQVAELSRRWRVVAYDQRGHARSGRATTGDYSVEALGADLDAVLRQTVSEGQRPLVAGHSMGGMSVVAWAGQHAGTVAERIAGAALISMGTEDLLHEALLLPVAAALAPKLTRRVASRALRTPVPLPRVHPAISQPIVRWFGLGRDADPAVVRFTERLVLGLPVDVRAAFGGTMANLAIADSVEQLKVPTLVIVGDADRLTPPSHSRRIAAHLPDGELAVLEGIGHMAPLEAPDEVNRLLADLAERVLAPVAD